MIDQMAKLLFQESISMSIHRLQRPFIRNGNMVVSHSHNLSILPMRCIDSCEFSASTSGETKPYIAEFRRERARNGFERAVFSEIREDVVSQECEHETNREVLEKSHAEDQCFGQLTWRSC